MPPRACLIPGCPRNAMRGSSRCSQHGGRNTNADRGYDAQHEAIAKRVRQATHCAKCGARGTSDNPIEAGHIIPRAEGGTNTPGNYRPECRRCNRSAGGRLGQQRRRRR